MDEYETFMLQAFYDGLTLSLIVFVACGLLGAFVSFVVGVMRP